jgi:hypothetical protein
MPYRTGGLLLGFASTSIRVGIQDRVSLHFFQPGLGIVAALAEADTAPVEVHLAVLLASQGRPRYVGRPTAS